MINDIYNEMVGRNNNNGGENNNNNAAKFLTEFKKQIVGEVVLTKYNTKTYRVDDVDTETNPNQTFTMSDGRTVSFVEYYRDHYQIDIRDKAQPMLIHRPKPSRNPLHVRPDGDKPILLVPELCYLTGLTERQRTDFQ